MKKAAAKNDAFDSEAYRTLFEGRISDPHAVLGMHTGKDGIVVRVYDPVAQEVFLLADGKKFLYRSYCGTMENRMDPQKLKEIRLAKAVETQMEAFKNGNTKK